MKPRSAVFYLLIMLMFGNAQASCTSYQWEQSFNNAIAEDQFQQVIQTVSQLTTYFKDHPIQKTDGLFRLPYLPKTVQEIFYDTPDLQLNRHNIALALRQNDFLSRYNAQKRQIIFQIKDRYTIFAGKKYKRQLTALDRHPLWGLIKKKQRQMLHSQLQNQYNIKPLSLIPVLTVQHTIQSYPVYLYYTRLAEIQLDHAVVEFYGFQVNHLFLRYRVFSEQINQTLATDQQQKARQLLGNLRCYLQKDLTYRSSLRSSDYSYYLQQIQQQYPWFSFFRRYPVLFKLGQIVVLSLFGSLVIALLLIRLQKRSIQHACYPCFRQRTLK